MEPVGFALVGAGKVAEIHARALNELPEARLVTVVSRTPEKARRLAQQYGAEWDTDLQRALSRPEVEAVDVCTPSGAHLEVVEAAATAGKHLIVEKPLEITHDRVERLIRVCEEAGVKLAGIFQHRFGIGIQEVKRALEGGRLGKLVLVDAYVKWYRPQSYYEGSWHGTWKLDGGGALMNQSIHTIDLMLWLVGPVTEVYAARTATLAHRMETEDTGVALLSLACGALGVIEGTTGSWPGDPARLELHGDKGTIMLEEGRIVRWDLADASPEERERMLSLETPPGSGSSDPMAIGIEKHKRQLEDFVLAIREDRDPAVDGAEARRAVELVLAIYESARTGRPVAPEVNR